MLQSGYWLNIDQMDFWHIKKKRKEKATAYKQKDVLRAREVQFQECGMSRFFKCGVDTVHKVWLDMIFTVDIYKINPDFTSFW